MPTLTFALLLLTQPLAASSSQAPMPAGATPAACLADVRAHAVKRQAELPPPPTATTASQTPEGLAALQAASERRAALSREIAADRLAMAKACAAKFDVTTAPERELGDLATLYTEASLPDLAKASIDRALGIRRSLPEAARAAVLLQAVQLGLLEPKGDARNTRLEALIDELDTLSPAAFNEQWSAHSTMQGYYRGDDIDAGIIKHATWIINAAKSFTPDQRARLGSTVVSAHVNIAEAWAGHGRTDDALALLGRALTEWADLPRIADRVQPTIDRYRLVGTAAAPITAPQWLNQPAGRTALELTGKVTLLEFTAHWCGPCKESYPGVNRLRARYGAQGFQVVLVTEFYGYFGSERDLPPAAELERNRAYFAEHGLDVPIAVANRSIARIVDGKVTYPDGPNPNTENYKVGGIPQIHLIDRQGRIRLIMVGYDDANEPKLAKMIEELLKK